MVPTVRVEHGSLSTVQGSVVHMGSVRLYARISSFFSCVVIMFQSMFHGGFVHRCYTIPAPSVTVYAIQTLLPFFYAMRGVNGAPSVTVVTLTEVGPANFFAWTAPTVSRSMVLDDALLHTAALSRRCCCCPLHD